MILVAGAQGDLGSAVTRMLLRQGKAVRILASVDCDDRALVEAGAQPMVGDLKHRAFLDAACRDVRTVISATDAFDGANDASVIDAAQAAGVEHFVYTSALAADTNSPVPFLAAKARGEAYLQASGLRYTIVAVNALMEGWPITLVGLPAMATKPVTLAGDGMRKHSFISCANAAQFMVAAADHQRLLNQRLELGGPEALSLRDVVAIYEWLLGRRIEVRTVGPGRPIPGLSAALWDMAASFDMFDSPVDMAETARAFGVRLTTMEVRAKRMLAASEPDS